MKSKLYSKGELAVICSIRSLGRLCAIALGLILASGSVSPAQSVADSYRKAAKAYREAADKATEDKKPCYDAWADYYDCLADSLQAGSTKTCEEPKCKPGESEPQRVRTKT